MQASAAPTKGHPKTVQASIPAPDAATALADALAQLEAQIKQQAQPVSLKQAIATGISRNPQLLQAFGTIQQYEWQLIAAQRQWYPTVQLNNGTPFAGVQWSTFAQNYPTSSPSAPPLYTNSSQLAALQPGASISWNAIDPSREPNIKAALASLRQQKLLFDVSARNLILDIQQTYFGLQSSQQLINSFRAIYQINQEQLAMLEAQKAIGMSTVLDVETTRSQLFAQLNQLVEYTRSYIEQAAALAEVMALPEGRLAIPSEAAAARGDWSMPLPQTIELAKRQREEIMASLAAAESARWSGVAALRSYLPVFQLVATGSLTLNSGSQTYNEAGGNITTPTTIRNGTGAIGLGFTWSLFDGGIQAANAQAANAQARVQGAQAASTQLQVIRQVRTSYAQLQTSRVGLSSAQHAYRAAELAKQASWIRYRAGVGDITSVVQTIDQWSTAAQQVATATLSYNTALAQLYRYAAIWPPQTRSEVEQQLQQLRLNPAGVPGRSRP